MDVKVHRNKEEGGYTSILEGDVQLDEVLGGHSEEALLPPPNEVDGQRFPAANLDQKSMRQDRQAAHSDHNQRYSSQR